MAFFSFAEGAAMFDSTPIENMFLLEHLSTAPEACLRVYLYGRMLALHPELGGDMAETARFLRMDEDAVYTAMAYWERQGLARRLSDRPPTYELLPLRAGGVAAGDAMEQTYYVYRDFNASLQSLFGRKLIEPREYRIVNDWLDVLGYDQDAALRLAQYGIETSRSKEPGPRGVFERMNKLAAAWADQGCRTLEDVERAIAEDGSVATVAREVLKRFSLSRKPTQDELNCARRWINEWGYTLQQVLDACGETTKSTKPSFAYLDAILKSRLEGNSALWSELSAVLKELDSPQAQPTPDQLERYAALRAQGFEPQTIRLAAVQCHRKKKMRLEDVEWMLKEWGSRGLYGHEAAEAYIRDMQGKAARVRALLETAGLERRPTMNDLALYDSWRAGHDESVIEYAAQCARGMQVPVKYMDKLLKDWQAAGVRTAEEAAARHELARQSRPASPGQPQANPALNYEQREYREEDFGDDFFLDVVKEYGSGGEGK